LDSKKNHPSIHDNFKAAPQSTPMTLQNEQAKAALYDALFNKHKKLAPKTKAKVLLDMVFDVDFMDNIIHKHIIIEARQFFRENVFNQETILQAMDMEGGKLNHAGIEILRQVENIYFSRTITHTKHVFSLSSQ
jgi:hypothetical protein